MRILMISDHADPLAEIGSKEAGGQNIYIYYLAKFLGRLGIFVDVFTRWDRKNKKEIIAINSHVRVIRVKAGPKKYMPRDNFLRVTKEFLDNALKIIQKENLKYDIIHSNYWYSGVIGLKISKILKIPIVHVYHSIGKIRFETLKKFKLQKSDYDLFQKRIATENEIAWKTDAIVATSPVEKDIIKKIFGVPSEKIKPIAIGVDTNIFRPVRTKKYKNNNERIILYVGRIEWRKGIGTLLYAFKEVLLKYPNAKLQIVGGGRSQGTKKLEKDECSRLKKIAKDLGLSDRVNFLGAKEQKILKRYYSIADVCTVPSYYEPFGIVPLESMACGTPVVASRTGGLKYTVKEDFTGELAEPRNFNDLAKKISLVFKNGKKYYQEKCLMRINDNFQWEKIAREYEKFFNRLIAK